MREITVIVILQQYMNHTLARTKIKENHSETLSYSLLYVFFICSCKFVVIETRAYDIARD